MAGTPARNAPLRRLLRDRRAQIALAFLALVILATVFAQQVGRINPNTQNLGEIFAGPSARHWLGTDDLGRDEWSRLVYGARTSLEAAAIAAGVAILIGTPVGVLTAYFGGWTDRLGMRVVDAFLAFPALVLAVGVSAALGPSLAHSMIAVGVVFSPGLARLMRAQVLVVKQRLWIDAARAYGSSHLRILRRHVLPAVIQPLLVQATLFLGLGLLAEAALSFLGLGVQPPTASWGSMLQEAYQYTSQAPGSIYPPGIAIGLTVVAFNSLGDAMRDAFDLRPAPRWRRIRVRKPTPMTESETT